MKRLVLPVSLVLASLVSAQRGPLPGMPLVPPPVDHPALAAQPLMQSDSQGAVAEGRSVNKQRASKKVGAARKARPVDPSTSGVQNSGRSLKKAIAKVTRLGWHKSLTGAKLHSASSGKPILWINSLGDLSGYA